MDIYSYKLYNPLVKCIKPQLNKVFLQFFFYFKKEYVKKE